MKEILLTLSVFLSGLFGTPVEPTLGATPALTVPQGGTGTTTFSAGKLLVGSNSLRITEVGTTSASCSGAASCSAFTVIGNSPVTISATGGTFPFTATASYNSTSTPIGFLQGLFSTASSTFNSTLNLPALSAGGLGVNGLGVVYSTPTTTFSGGLTYSNGNVTADLGTSIDISAETNLGATWPVILTGDTLSFGGISTSSAISAASGLLYATGVNTIASISTSSAIVMSITGNAGTATALAADPSDCSAGSFTLGINASGAAQGCTDAWTEAENTSAAYISDGNTNWDNSYGFTTFAYLFPSNATSTELRFNDGLISTASTTINARLELPSLSTGALSLDTTSAVYSTATGTITAGTGISFDNSTRQVFGGNLQVTNSGVISGSCSGGTTCSGTNPLTINSFSYPFPSDATSTLINFSTGLRSASTTLTGPFVFANATGTNATTTSLAVLNLTSASCDVKALTTGVIYCGTDSTGGGGAFPFSATTNYGQVVYATSTPTLWFQSGFFASSTSHLVNASSTMQTISGTLWVGTGGANDSEIEFGPSLNEWTLGYDATDKTFAIASSTVLGTTNALTINKSLLTTLLGGYVSQASSTVVGDFTVTGTTKLATSLTGLALTTSGTVSAYGGASCTYTLQSLSASGAATCNGFAYPFSGTTSFGSTANSTSTLMLLTNGLSASSTVRFGNVNVSGQFTWDSVIGGLGIGTSTPRWALQLASSTFPQLALSDGSNTSAHWVFRNAGGNLYIASSSPLTFATSSNIAAAVTILSNGQVSTAERNIATSTTMTIDWATTPNQVLVQILGAAMTIGFNNASTSGMTKRIIVCNGNTAASTVTWGGRDILWPSATAPTHTTTVRKCDVFSFIVTQATSTVLTTTKVFGNSSLAF